MNTSRSMKDLRSDQDTPAAQPLFEALESRQLCSVSPALTPHQIHVDHVAHVAHVTHVAHVDHARHVRFVERQAVAAELTRLAQNENL